MNHSEVEWTEVPVEGHVNKILKQSLEAKSGLTLSMLKKKALWMFCGGLASEIQ